MLSLSHALAERSRLISQPARSDAVAGWEIATLIGCGLGASAAVVLLDFSLRIPGHAILRSVIPLSFGLALVPRRGAGLTMSASALVGVLTAFGMGFSPGMGATTSLLTVGPLLDLAARQARHGWRLFAAFGVAALLSNVLAFAARGAGRLVGMGGGVGRGGGWWSIAPVSYAACGLLAGTVCAVIWFRWSTDSVGDCGKSTVGS